MINLFIVHSFPIFLGTTVGFFFFVLIKHKFLEAKDIFTNTRLRAIVGILNVTGVLLDCARCYWNVNWQN